MTEDDAERQPMKLSVCIPAYNRVEVLPELLDSVLAQDYDDYEVVIVEDRSPQRAAIRAVVDQYKAKTDRIRYFENEQNLGYDGNLRETISRSTGDYCFFMGNDDLMCPGALRTVAEGIARHPKVGVVLRTWAAFEGDPKNIVSTSRYFEGERFFPMGEDTIVTFYRRSVVIPGMVLHRGKSMQYHTNHFDGITLYQCWLVANILAEMNGLFLPQVLVLYRQGNTPFFGAAEAERGKFTPESHTPEGSLFFLRGMLDIARAVDEQRGVRVTKRVVKDMGHYSYPFLWMQADKPFGVFTRYAWRVARAGLWRSPMLFLYYILLVLFGTKRVDRWIQLVKRRLGRTPALGGVYQGVKRS
ncbi:MAG TPA: glycosyltransferase family 2 protein [Thermoanaerobaculia bacterium]|jgi:glycosyltransferase involved in cell wall biosynthesis|nr:glycosyltransferase family 2 protein [Thermoanaerobaculia bacterium]